MLASGRLETRIKKRRLTVRRDSAGALRPPVLIAHGWGFGSVVDSEVIADTTSRSLKNSQRHKKSPAMPGFSAFESRLRTSDPA